jgi:hypothetical protein
VCGERAGKHSYYGGQVCPSCRAFFRRSVQIPVLRIRIHRIHMFLGHPEPLVRDTDPKIVRKTLIHTVLSLLYDFLSLKIDVNVPSKSIHQKYLEKK